MFCLGWLSEALEIFVQLRGASNFRKPAKKTVYTPERVIHQGERGEVIPSPPVEDDDTLLILLAVMLAHES